MNMQNLYYVFETEFGWMTISGDEGKISGLELPKPTRSDAISALLAGNSIEYIETNNDFSGEAERLISYFAGKPVEFQCEIDVPYASPFDLQVWETARQIGYGETRTYGWIADTIGHPGAARAVGSALGRNQVTIIVPCHRVVRTDGGLGGFNSGIEWKVRLLDLERTGKGI